MRMIPVMTGMTALLASGLLHGQTLRQPFAASYLSFGAYSTGEVTVFSPIANTASLAQLQHPSAGVYAERRFFLAELSNYVAAAASPTRFGNAAVKAAYAGSTPFNETQLSFAYARRLNKADVGVQFNYHGMHIAGYGQASTVTAEGGAIFHLSEKLHTGIHIFNPAGGNFSKGDGEKLPLIYTAGFGYEPSQQVFFHFEIKKEENFPFSVNAAIQYRVIPLVWARGGISSATSMVWFGFGLLLDRFRIDISSSYHPQLGLTPGLMLILSPSSKKAKEEVRETD